MSSRLQMKEAPDRLALAYHTFFTELEVPEPSANRAEFRFSITGKGRPPEEAYLTLQLRLKAGESLETPSGPQSITSAPIELVLTGAIRHRGWTLRTDSEASLKWPVYPFNPYANGPEKDVANAVATLTIPIRLKGGASVRPGEQRISIVLEAQ